MPLEEHPAWISSSPAAVLLSISAYAIDTRHVFDSVSYAFTAFAQIFNTQQQLVTFILISCSFQNQCHSIA